MESSGAARLFETALAWLRDTYDERPYYQERDVVYAVQVQLWKMVHERGLRYEVFNDSRCCPVGKGRSASAAACLAHR